MGRHGQRGLRDEEEEEEELEGLFWDVELVFPAHRQNVRIRVFVSLCVALCAHRHARKTSVTERGCLLFQTRVLWTQRSRTMQLSVFFLANLRGLASLRRQH